MLTSDNRDKEANQEKQLWVWSSGIDMTCNQASQKKNVYEKRESAEGGGGENKKGKAK